MNEPARKLYDDEGEQKPVSAQDRANQHWGMAPSEPEPEDSTPDSDVEGSARDRADQRWGMAPDKEKVKDAEEKGGLYNPEGGDAKEQGAASEPGGARKLLERFKGLSPRKKVIGGGVAGGGVVGVVGVLTILQGPFQIMQVSNLISGSFFTRNNNTSDTSVRRIYNTISGQREKNNLGAAASKLASNNLADLKEVGIEPVFETANGKGRAKIQSYSIDPDTPQGKNMLGRALVEGADIRNGPNGRRIINVRGREGGRIARALADQMIEVSGKKHIAAVVAKRRLKTLFGVDFHPLNIAKRALEDRTDYKRRRRAERAKEAKEGVETRTTGDAVGQPDEDGKPEPVDGQVESDSKDVKDVIDDIGNTEDPFEKKSKLRALRNSSLLKGGATAAAVVAVTCAVKDVGDDVTKYKMDNVIKPLIRLTMQYVSAGSQVQAMQDVNMDEVGSVTEALYDEETGTSWASAAPIKAARGESGGVEPNPAVKSQINSSYNGDKPALFNILDSIPFLGTACSANNWFGNLPIVKQIGSVTNSLLSGLSSVTTGKSIDDWMGDLVAVLAGESIDTLAEGVNLGNLLPFGAVLSANASGIASGEIELNSEQAAQWDQYNYAIRQAEQKEKSWAKRTFDLSSYDSLASTIVMRTPKLTNSRTFTSWTQKVPTNLFGSMFKPFAAFMSQPASAQTISGYDYGLPEFGIPLSTLNDDRYEDIYENLDRLEDNNFAKLKQANKNWGKCFGEPIDDSGNIKDREVEDYEATLSSDCTSSYNNPDFKDYQMYILDNVTIRSMACYEGDETSCQQLGFGGNTAIPTATSPPPPEGVVSPPNLGPVVASNYYGMPDAVNGEYEFNGNTPPSDRCGSKELVDVIYTVAKRWNDKYPGSKLRVGDLNAGAGHASHKNGVDVDIFTVDRSAADTSGDPEKSKELGRMFIDTKAIKVIFYNDGAVQNHVNAYAQSKGQQPVMEFWPGHEDHFHVRILDQYRLATSLGCPA